MGTIAIAVLVLAAIAFSDAEDDGRYRPELRGGSDGEFHPVNVGHYFDTLDGKYRSLVKRNGNNNYVYNQPFYAEALNRQLLAPSVKYENSFDQNAASFASVTRPSVIPAASTYRPFAYSSTPKPSPQPVYKTQYIPDRSANVITQDSDFDVNTYHYSFKTDNGITAEESGNVEPAPNGGGTRVRGFYEYVGDDGRTYRVDYTADENGFRPSGAHLP